MALTCEPKRHKPARLTRFLGHKTYPDYQRVGSKLSLQFLATYRNDYLVVSYHILVPLHRLKPQNELHGDTLYSERQTTALCRACT
jgi:hypothetical protein